MFRSYSILQALVVPYAKRNVIAVWSMCSSLRVPYGTSAGSEDCQTMVRSLTRIALRCHEAHNFTLHIFQKLITSGMPESCVLLVISSKEKGLASNRGSDDDAKRES